MSNRPHAWDFFLAHASSDERHAEELYDELSSHARVFLDKRSIPDGADWDLELSKAQRSSRVTVAIISSQYERAYYLREEIAIAVALARHSPSEHTIVPVYLDEANETIPFPYGLSIKQGISIRKLGGLKGAAEKLLDRFKALTNQVSLEEAYPKQPLNHQLHQFPCGPMVPSHIVKRNLIEAYASMIPPSHAASVLDEAIAIRLEADPYDPTVTYVKHAHVVPPESVAPITYWLTVFKEACLHGPRMLAALLTAVDDSRFPTEAKESRRRLLEQLSTSH